MRFLGLICKVDYSTTSPHKGFHKRDISFVFIRFLFHSWKKQISERTNQQSLSSTTMSIQNSGKDQGDEVWPAIRKPPMLYSHLGDNQSLDPEAEKGQSPQTASEHCYFSGTGWCSWNQVLCLLSPDLAYPLHLYPHHHHGHHCFFFFFLAFIVCQALSEAPSLHYGAFNCYKQPLMEPLSKTPFYS